MEASQRSALTGAGEEDARSKRFLDCAIVSLKQLRQSGLATSVTHSNPYLTVGLNRREAGRDCDTSDDIAVIHDSE